MGDSSNQSVAGSSNNQPEQVEINVDGIPISANSTKISSRMGALVKTHVPISWTSWDLVPEKYKDDVWHGLLKSYDLPEVSKPHYLKKMSDTFRKHKSNLQKSHYDIYPNDDLRKQNPPPNVSYEDWEEFCKNEKTDEAIKRRKQNKKNREAYDYGHTTGREGHARVAAVMKKENPTEEISRDDVWKRTHARKSDGSILPSAAPYLERINKVLEESAEKGETSLSLETDALSKVFGLDSRGRTRAVGTTVSRTQIKASAPARALLASSQVDTTDWRAKIENTLGVVLKSINALHEGMKGTNPTSEDDSNVMGSSTPQSDLARGTCALLNIDQEVIAVGKVCKGELAQLAHGNLVPATHEKVVLDKILLPGEKIAKQNHSFAETFGEVGVGGYVVHPKFAIRYD